MNSFPQFRSYLESEFTKNPEFTLDSSELTALGSEILNGAGLDPILLQRLRFMLADERDDRFICFNAEAVTFGILTHSRSSELAQDSNIQRFMREHALDEYDPETLIGDFHTTKERKNKYIQRSQRLTNRAMKALELPIDETQFTVGRNDICTLYFVSSDTFLRALFACKNTKTFSDYGARFMKLHTIYDSIKSKYLTKATKSLKKTIEKNTRALMKKDEAISQKRNTVESIMARLDEMQNEARAGTKKLETKIDEVSSDNKKLKTKVGQLHQKSNKTMEIANKTMAKLNETFDLLRDVAYKSASLPDDPKKHHYLGITLSVSRQKNTDLPVYKLYTTRRQSRDISTVVKKRLPGTGEKHVGCSIILCGPIYTMSPISSVNSFREKFEERCSELIDQRYQNDEDDDLTVEDIMNHIQVKDSNNISWFSNPYISVVDIVAMMIDEIKIAQRDAYDVPCEWPRLMKANETNKPIFDDRIRKIGFKDPDMVLQEVSSIVERVNTLVATHNNP